MSITVDHYECLGLPSWEEGSKLSLKQITEAYKKKILEFQLAKRPKFIFNQIKRSYGILSNEDSRRYFDEELIRVKQEQQRRSRLDSKRKNPILDVEARKRFPTDPKILKEIHEEEKFMERDIRDKRLKMDCLLKISWQGSEDAYSAKTLKELFKQFGGVQYVVPNKAADGFFSFYVKMATRDEAVSALEGARGYPFTILQLGQRNRHESSSFTEGLDILEGHHMEKHLSSKDAEGCKAEMTSF